MFHLRSSLRVSLFSGLSRTAQFRVRFAFLTLLAFSASTAAGCATDPATMESLSDPGWGGEGKSDNLTQRSVFVGELEFGNAATGSFQQGDLYGFEFAAHAGDAVTISLSTTTTGTDPIMFVYEPRTSPTICEHGPSIATNDDIAWPTDVNARLENLELSRDGMYLIVIADKALSSGAFELRVDCTSGQCDPRLVCGGLSSRGCPDGYACVRELACESYSGSCEAQCVDQDGDGFGVGSCDQIDCDDTRPECTSDCADRNRNGVPDCAEQPEAAFGRIAAGWERTTAVHATGEAIQWGFNAIGAFAPGNVVDSDVPLRVPLRPSNRATQVAEGHHVSCAVVDGGAFCWGGGLDGEVGLGGLRDQRNGWYEPIPQSPRWGEVRSIVVTDVDRGVWDYEISDPLSSVVEISLGDDHSCALLSSGKVFCWGSDDFGQRGSTYPNLNYLDHYDYDDAVFRADYWGFAAEVYGLDNVRQIDAGVDHTCATHHSGSISCWGDNEKGQLGDGTEFNFSIKPKLVVGVADAIQVSAGDDSTCALRTDGSVWCWGRVHSHILSGELRANTSPVAVLGLSEPMKQVSVGWRSQTCALGESGAVYCWGRGVLGTGTEEEQASEFPLRVLGIEGAVDISVGVNHACARLASGSLRCWGRNGRGQVGDGSRQTRFSPVPVRDSL